MKIEELRDAVRLEELEAEHPEPPTEAPPEVRESLSIPVIAAAVLKDLIEQSPRSAEDVKQALIEFHAKVGGGTDLITYVIERYEARKGQFKFSGVDLASGPDKSVAAIVEGGRVKKTVTLEELVKRGLDMERLAKATKAAGVSAEKFSEVMAKISLAPKYNPPKFSKAKPPHKKFLGPR